MRTIIAGSRSITDYRLLLEAIHRAKINITTVISGTAFGVDLLGERYAREHNIPIERYPADWLTYKKSAGYIRNTTMAKIAEACVVLYDGISKGSRHMVNIAHKHHLLTKVYQPKRRIKIMKRVFLGGTTNESNWRNDIIVLLKDSGLDYFNPIVDDWNEEAQQRELNERASCDFCLYTITPKMKSCYSAAEAADDSNKRPEKVIFCVLETDGDATFDDDQLQSMESIGLMVERNGGCYCKSLEAAVLHMYHLSEITIESLLDTIPFKRKR